MNDLRHFFQGVAAIRKHTQKLRISQTMLTLMLAGVIGIAAGCGSQQTPVSASSSGGLPATSQSELFTVPPEQRFWP
jgi:hypothetical protein